MAGLDEVQLSLRPEDDGDFDMGDGECLFSVTI